jgi:hypothetical protein
VTAAVAKAKRMRGARITGRGAMMCRENALPVSVASLFPTYKNAIPDESGRPSVGFTFSDEPDPDDLEFEQQGLRIFVEGALVEPLDGRTLDVRDADDLCASAGGPIPPKARRPVPPLWPSGLFSFAV